MKRLFKAVVVAILGRQVRALRRRHQFKIVGVVGGIGKTSTKLAIAQTLQKTLRVRYQDGNYNDIVSVPLILFGQTMPSLLSPFAWLKIFASNSRQIRGDYPYDVVVVELGTDGPGQIAAFAKYLRLDITVLTSVVPEHMEYFADLQAVANEELSVINYSDQVIYSHDFVAEQFRVQLPESSLSYSLNDKTANFFVDNLQQSEKLLSGDIWHGNNKFVYFQHPVISDMQLYSVLAAVAVGKLLGMNAVQLEEGIKGIGSVSGRLQTLPGLNGSIIIDDTYNASPEAVKAGLKALYDFKAGKKIAILGNMNELGTMSPQAHTEVGQLCDHRQLEWVITIGPDANAHLAPAAAKNGCKVQKFDNPYDAGEFLKSKLDSGTVVFAKGSQNGVFAEEAVKLLLADINDASKLVRQSPQWLAKKRKAFKRG